MTFSINNILKISVLALALTYLICGLSESICLPTADLGRHITNGRIILEALQTGADLKTQTPLYQNFYSYTEPGYPAINHHWLTGVVHYLTYKSFGFLGLSILNISVIILGIIFFFLAARMLAGTELAILALVLTLPILVWRDEVRPESLSYMLMGLEFYILTLFRANKLNFKWVITLLALSQVLWINLHIFFSIGIFMIGTFYLESAIKSGTMFKDIQTRKYFYIFIAVIFASLINPFGLTGLLEPLKIFHNYAYDLIENQAIWFMHKRFPSQFLYYYFDILIIINLTLWIMRYRKSVLGLKEFIKSEFAFTIISLVLALLALKTIRTIPVFVLSSIPILAYNCCKFSQPTNLSQSKFQSRIYLVLLTYIILLFNITHVKLTHYKNLGINPAIHQSAEFFRAVNIQGPIFNNYDIGGYLIFHLFPARRVFVDNRPEAYSTRFFNEIYKPMQESETKWHEIDSQINFNVIYFMRHDLTEHAQPFLIRRISDPAWAPVFVDNWNIILLKRNKQNKAIINKYELAQAMFRAVKGD